MIPPTMVIFAFVVILCLLAGLSLLARYSELPFRYKDLLPFIPRRRLFLFCLFSLVAKMAKADGRVCEEEIRLFRGYVRSNIRLTPFEERQAARVFRGARDSSLAFVEVAAEFVKYYRYEPGVLFAMLTLLAKLAAADGTVAAREYTFLKQFAELIDMAPHRFCALMAEIFREVRVEVPSEESGQGRSFDNGGPDHRSTPLQEAYRTLGLTPDCSWEIIRATYRRLAKHHHPDRLRAQGVPTESMRSSTERFRTLKDAYELIREDRGK